MRSLDVKIVLIEEAAEVLEAHVLACLAPSVQQLILIGGEPAGILICTAFNHGKCCASLCARFMWLKLISWLQTTSSSGQPPR